MVLGCSVSGVGAFGTARTTSAVAATLSLFGLDFILLRFAGVGQVGSSGDAGARAGAGGELDNGGEWWRAHDGAPGKAAARLHDPRGCYREGASSDAHPDIRCAGWGDRNVGAVRGAAGIDDRGAPEAGSSLVVRTGL